MVTRRIRTEYMKKFKDPKWETYSRCYEELLHYRLSRRMLEHSHKPWFWSGSDTDSDTSPPHTRNKDNQVDPLRENEDNGTMADAREQQEENQCGGGGGGPAGPMMVLVPKICLSEEEEDGGADLHASAVNGGPSAAAGVHSEENAEHKTSSRGSKPPDKPPVGSHVQHTSKPRKSCLRASRVRPASLLQKPREDTKENRHPFALYGSGEQHAEMAGRKTHNVCPAASTKEHGATSRQTIQHVSSTSEETLIHESAIRAKTRREVERQIQAQRAERQKTKSADLAKTKTKLSQPEFNPWLTEYMRCFSSCSR